MRISRLNSLFLLNDKPWAILMVTLIIVILFIVFIWNLVLHNILRIHVVHVLVTDVLHRLDWVCIWLGILMNTTMDGLRLNDYVLDVIVITIGSDVVINHVIDILCIVNFLTDISLWHPVAWLWHIRLSFSYWLILWSKGVLDTIDLPEISCWIQTILRIKSELRHLFLVLFLCGLLRCIKRFLIL